MGASAGASGEAYLAEASVAHPEGASAVDPSEEAYPRPAEGRCL